MSKAALILHGSGSDANLVSAAAHNERFAVFIWARLVSLAEG